MNPALKEFYEYAEHHAPCWKEQNDSTYMYCYKQVCHECHFDSECRQAGLTKSDMKYIKRENPEYLI